MWSPAHWCAAPITLRSRPATAVDSRPGSPGWSLSTWSVETATGHRPGRDEYGPDPLVHNGRNVSTQRGGDDPDEYGREAMAAFAHDMRTPLTTIRMVTELARRQSPERELRLDGELAEMFEASARDLGALADALQETSRL